MCGEQPTDKSCIGAMITRIHIVNEQRRGGDVGKAADGLALSHIDTPTAVSIFIKRDVLPFKAYCTLLIGDNPSAPLFSDTSLSWADSNVRCLQKRKECQTAHRRLKLSAALEHRLRGEEWHVHEDSSLHRRKRAMRTGRVRNALHTNRAEYS